MTDQPLRPATREELCQALGYALQHTRTGKTHRHAADFMARIGAEVLTDHLLNGGFVITKKLRIGDLALPTSPYPLKK